MNVAITTIRPANALVYYLESNHKDNVKLKKIFWKVIESGCEKD